MGRIKQTFYRLEPFIFLGNHVDIRGREGKGGETLILIVSGLSAHFSELNDTSASLKMGEFSKTFVQTLHPLIISHVPALSISSRECRQLCIAARIGL